MVEIPGSETELRYRNVTIHSQGKTEHGTLNLLKHHVCFTYYPGGKDGDRSNSHSRHPSGSHRPAETDFTKSSNGLISGTQQVNGESSSSHMKSHGKVRPKEIWIPYPMISSCLLRPSHSASTPAQPDASDGASTEVQSQNDLFPPTFGSSGYERQSTDSARLASFPTPPRPLSPSQTGDATPRFGSIRQPVIRVRRKDFGMMALHFNAGQSGLSGDEIARQAFHVLRKRCCIDSVQQLHAFDYRPPKDESRAAVEYDARREFARMGISPKAADGPGIAWRVTDINHDYSYSRTYPNVMCVPKAVSDNTLKYGGTFRSKSRIPCLSYLHSNGGSITRASQPMVGVRSKRNPQDERLVSAIFASHIPPLPSPQDSPPQVPSLTSSPSATQGSSPSEPPGLSEESKQIPISRSETALDRKMDDKPSTPRIYGSTRQNMIADARPYVNATVNRLGGGGMEDISKYTGSSHVPIEKVFLNIANIHTMRSSLAKVVESFGSADYVDMKPNQETLRKSGWLRHIQGLLDGSETVARVVGLGGSHVLVHCSDGWDRTSQVAAIAEIMLDPHYRTMTGFISLIQKDFLSFGHKFRDRDGIEGCERWFDIENERIAPKRPREIVPSEGGGLNAMGQKAFSGAKKWLEKNRDNLFNQHSNNTRGTPDEDTESRPSSPPPNPIIHSAPSPTSKEEKAEMDPDEVSPVFHQFLEAVFQLIYQYPNAFEFNERFLRRLFYHTYSCQYGEFLFNNERERSQHKLPSVWGYFLSRRSEFTNPDYVAKTEDPLLFPRRQGREREVEVRWWASLFGRKDEEMNLPKALAPPDSLPNTIPLRASVSVEEPTGEGESKAGPATSENAIKETKSTPSLAAMRDSLTNSFSSMRFGYPEARKESAPEPLVNQPVDIEPSSEAAEKEEIEDLRDTQTEATATANEPAKFDRLDMDDGDPLGVSSSAPKQVGSSKGLDFAAFASQNAFSER